MAGLCPQFLLSSRGLAGLSAIHNASVYFGEIHLPRVLKGVLVRFQERKPG